MSHDHHHDTENLSDGRLIVAVAVNMLLTVAQMIGGIVSGSLSLVADALHNFSDAGSLGIALFARRAGRRPADRKRTFGYRKAEAVGALINLTTLIVIGLYLVVEAIWRAIQPEPIDGWIVIIIAGIALVIDGATAMLTYALSRDNLNIRAAFIHNLSDAFASVGVIIAGSLILLYGWHLADAIATLLIAIYVLYQGFTMMRQTIALLMDSVPADVDLDEVIAAALAIEGVTGVHHLHIWQLGEHHRAMEAHVVTSCDSVREMESIKRAIKETLAARFDITHSTLEMEHPDLVEDDVSHDDRLIVPH